MDCGCVFIYLFFFMCLYEDFITIYRKFSGCGKYYIAYLIHVYSMSEGVSMAALDLFYIMTGLYSYIMHRDTQYNA